MIAQGIYILMYLSLTCNPQLNVCYVDQIAIDAYRNKQICDVMAAEMSKRIPNEIFYCTEERNI